MNKKLKAILLTLLTIAFSVLLAYVVIHYPRFAVNSILFLLVLVGVYALYYFIYNLLE